MRAGAGRKWLAEIGKLNFERWGIRWPHGLASWALRSVPWDVKRGPLDFGGGPWNNVSRWIPRKLMAEFEMRVLYQMSANDSANLIDSPAATTLGLHCALFYNEHLGTLETFRPYAMPDTSWFEWD